LNPLSIFACENQPIVLEGLLRVLGELDDLRLSGHAPDLETTLRRAGDEKPDILLLGQPPALKSILPLLARARQVDIEARIILWVAELSDMDSFRALQMGARGVITRTQPVDAILECFRTVGEGNVWLEASSRGAVPRSHSGFRITPREREIIELVCRGLKNKEIAEVMSITPGTVKVHLMHIFEKTGARDRFQLALQGQQILTSMAGEEPKPLARAAGAGR
jgi:two-component system, NarL family, nitrate/nitrite response regulator NarL